MNDQAIFHSRRNFYNGRPVYWYEFKLADGNNMWFSQIGKFLKVPYTKYYEYGGTHDQALVELKSLGYVAIEGEEI